MASREQRHIIISRVTIEKVEQLVTATHGRDPDDISMQGGLGYFRGIHETPGRGSGYVFECAICRDTAEWSWHLTGRPVDDGGTGFYDFSESPRQCLRQAIEESRIARNRVTVRGEPWMQWGNCCDHSWFVNDCCIAMVEEKLNDANKLTINIKHQAMTRENYLIGSERGSNNVRRRVDGVDDLFVGGGID